MILVLLKVGTQTRAHSLNSETPKLLKELFVRTKHVEMYHETGYFKYSNLSEYCTFQMLQTLI